MYRSVRLLAYAAGEGEGRVELGVRATDFPLPSTFLELVMQAAIRINVYTFWSKRSCKAA